MYEHIPDSASTYILIDAKDLKSFAIRTGVVVVYAGVVYWSWKAQVKPAIQEHKERKARKQRDEWRKRSERIKAEQAKQASS